MTITAQAISSSNRKLHKLYARLETPFGLKEYQRGGRCVRFIGIKPKEFKSLDEDGGVIVRTIDISYWRFCDLMHIGRWPLLRTRESLQEDSNAAIQFTADWYKPWYELTFEWCEDGGDGYTYPSFGKANPRYFKLLAILTIDAGPSLTEPRQSGSLKYTANAQTWNQQSPVSNVNSAWSLNAYHVGQGMCALLTNGTEGWLFDAGAGTPILRPKYLAGLRINHILDDIKPLSNIKMVLSHADQDHWRLLGWGDTLANKVSEIFVPHGAKSLVYKDKAIMNKCRNSTGFQVNLTNGGKIDVHRSSPSKSSDNTQCLVSVYTSVSGESVLLSGDYVYSGMASDSCGGVSALAFQTFAAVVVPHHGDLASAMQVYSPQMNQHSKAFFSAGNHKLYGHPTCKSIDEHKKAGFNVVSSPNCSNIQRVNLI